MAGEVSLLVVGFELLAVCVEALAASLLEAEEEEAVASFLGIASFLSFLLVALALVGLACFASAGMGLFFPFGAGEAVLGAELAPEEPDLGF